MQFVLSPVQLATICAIVNGFVFSFLLLEKKENRKANRFLSLMIFCMCLTFTPYMLDPNIWHTYRWLAWMPFSLTYWIGPAFYFYIRTLTSVFKLRKKDLWHFSPVVLNYIHSIYHSLTGESNPWIWFHYFSEYLESMAIVSIVIYLIISYRMINTYQTSLLQNVSNIEGINLTWIRKMILIIAGSFLIILLFLIVSTGMSGKYRLNQWDEARSFTLLLYSSILYWLSISGYRQAQTYRLPDLEAMTFDSGEPSELIHSIRTAIETEKLYRNPELSLMDLSKAARLSERAISTAINQELGKNFYQFINEYRVEELKRLLKDPTLNHLKIISLAMDAGFNSKASLNRVFKAFTGMSPKAWQEANS
ncbi:MAG: helix-turn-helix domain-containing protein [Cyclobacteriaceae bacterium]